MLTARSFGVALGLAALVATHAPARQSASAAQVPAPLGPFGISRVANHWIDQRRADPFAIDTHPRRELMVYLWYPTETHTANGVYHPDAAAISSAPQAARLRQSSNGAYWEAVLSGAVTSHAGDAMPLAPTPSRLPVVLFSHGDVVATSFSYTTLVEDLVSRGYVVAAVEHPWSSAVVRFPSGLMIFGADREQLRGDRAPDLPYFDGVELAMRDMRLLADVEAADLRYVVDQLERVDRNRASTFFGRLDLTEIAAVGHSLGGMAALRACQLDLRMKACVNQDGTTADGVFLQYPGAPPLKQPSLFIDATPPETFTDQQLGERGITRKEWTAYTTKLGNVEETQLRSALAGAYRIRLLAAGIGHSSFGDAVLPAATPDAQQLAQQNTRLTIEVTRAFLDKMLKGYGRTLVDEPSDRHPEWTMRRYGAQP
jgi:predicted dienelactone hydrolase